MPITASKSSFLNGRIKISLSTITTTLLVKYDIEKLNAFKKNIKKTQKSYLKVTLSYELYNQLLIFNVLLEAFCKSNNCIHVIVNITIYFKSFSNDFSATFFSFFSNHVYCFTEYISKTIFVATTKYSNFFAV